jgi:hypothetical protein
MPPSKKRKAATLDHADDVLSKQRDSEVTEASGMPETTTPSPDDGTQQEPSGDDESAKDNTAALKAQERKERFKALQACAVSIF